MRIRLPFIGTLLKSYTEGTVPTFDLADPMYPIDDALEGHGYMVVMDSFDFDAGTVEVEVKIEPLMRVRLPDDSEVWEDEIPEGTVGEVVVIGQQGSVEYGKRVAAEESKILANVKGKDATTLRADSKRYSGRTYTDAEGG